MPAYEGLSSLGILSEKHTTVVFDIGSAYTKLGFAGETGPRAIIKSQVICRKSGKFVKIFDYDNEEDLRHHIVDFIHKIYFKYLLVNSKDRRVILVESLLCPTLIRNTLATVLFRHFEVLSILFAPSPLVSLMTLGVSTGLILDLGYEEASLIPVYEGVAILRAWQALPLGSREVHRSLNDLLLDRALCLTPDAKEIRLSAADITVSENVLEDLKVRTCFVSTIERSKALYENKYDRSQEPPPPPPQVEYPLGGDCRLTIPGTVREMTAEVMFQQDEDQLSVPSMILDALIRCPIDTRQNLANNLVVIGGTASLTGLKHRLLTEVQSLALAPKYAEKMQIKTVKIHTPPAKDNYVAWLGGAILGATEAVGFRSLSRDHFLSHNSVPDWINLSYNVKEGKSA